MTPSFLETAAEIVAGQLRSGARDPATPWTGSAEDALTAETEVAASDRLEREAKARAEWQITPRGRFHVNAFAIFEATGDGRLLACSDRGLSGADYDRAALMLDSMEGPAAHECRAALIDLHPLFMAAE